MNLITILSALIAVSAASPIDEHLEDTVRLLKGQVQALLEQREQDSQMAQELKTMREDIVQLKSVSKKGHNAEVRLGWLESSVSEARGQLSEVGAALTRQRSLSASVSQLRTLVDRQAAEIRALRANIELINEKFEAFNSKREREREETHNSVTSDDTDSLSMEKRTRHHRGLRARVDEVEREEGKLANQVASLGKRTRVLEDTKNSLPADKLRASVLELLETVQGLEAKLDQTVPSLQKEISRTELNLAQVMQQSALLKENQENHRATLKALSVGMSTMQDKMSSKQKSIAHTPASVEHKVVESNCNVTKLLTNLTRVVDDYQSILSNLPHDCYELGELTTGEKLIRPGAEGSPVLVDCQKGWTVVQRRSDGSQEFNKKWEEYAIGFGSPTGEFWIGNEALHRLTKENKTSLRVELVDIYGGAWYAEYSSFNIGPREDGFRLNVSGYKGNASDALDYQNGMEFSAVDSDRDASNTHCAANYEGGWWYSHCEHANLNGRYNLGLTWFHAGRNEWIAVDKSTMMIRNHK